MIRNFFRNRFGQKGSDSTPPAGQGRGYGRNAGDGGRGRGGGNKPGSGPGGNCVCPKCGYQQPHVAGQRCLDQVCPQ